MIGVGFTIRFDALEGEDDDALWNLTQQLADDLADVCEVDYLSSAAPLSKSSIGEFILGALTVFTSLELTQLQDVMQTIVAFLSRHQGRRATLEVGDLKFELTQPTQEEVARLIEIVRAAVEEETRH